jgi:copper chaperone NosL
MRFAVAIVVGVALAACSTLQPLPIRSGETCYGCRQVIGDPRLAAEVIDASGHAFKFDTVECLARYLNGHPDEKVSGVFVADYKTGRLVNATSAQYVKGQVDPRSLKKGYAAFASAADAQAFAKEQHSEPLGWQAVLDAFK